MLCFSTLLFPALSFSCGIMFLVYQKKFLAFFFTNPRFLIHIKNSVLKVDLELCKSEYVLLNDYQMRGSYNASSPTKPRMWRSLLRKVDIKFSEKKL